MPAAGARAVRPLWHMYSHCAVWGCFCQPAKRAHSYPPRRRPPSCASTPKPTSGRPLVSREGSLGTCCAGCPLPSPAVARPNLPPCQTALWVSAGAPAFSPAAVAHTSLAFMPDGTPAVGFKDTAAGGRASVMWHHAPTGAWLPLGRLGLSAGEGSSAAPVAGRCGSQGRPGCASARLERGRQLPTPLPNRFRRPAHPRPPRCPRPPAGEAEFTRLAAGGDGHLYLAYEEATPVGSRAAVQRYSLD